MPEIPGVNIKRLLYALAHELPAGIDQMSRPKEYKTLFNQGCNNEFISFTPDIYLYQKSPVFWIDQFLENNFLERKVPYSKWTPDYEVYRRYPLEEEFRYLIDEVEEKRIKREELLHRDIFEAGWRLLSAGWGNQR